MDERQYRRRMWLSRRAVLLHLTVVVVVPVFLGLFWWQVQRVRQGNTLSWAYVFEWPFFTGYALYLWWKLVHEQPGLEGSRTVRGGVRGGAEAAAAPRGPTEDTTAARDTGPDEGEEADEGEDEELAAYNRYLAELHAAGRPKSR